MNIFFNENTIKHSNLDVLQRQYECGKRQTEHYRLKDRLKDKFLFVNSVEIF